MSILGENRFTEGLLHQKTKSVDAHPLKRKAVEVMCRTLVSVGYDGAIYDCDFNLSLDLPMVGHNNRPFTIFNVETLSIFDGGPIKTDVHCLGCTGGNGSGCFGGLA